MTEHRYPAKAVLLVDDEVAWLNTLSLTLERSADITNVLTCQDSRQVLSLLNQHDIGIVLLDLVMPHLSGEQVLREIAPQHPDVAVIIVTGMNQIETAVNCMREGAFDYVVKTAQSEQIIKGVRRAIQVQELQRESLEMRRRFVDDRLERPEAFQQIVTQDKGMRSVFHYVEAVATSLQPVLITGESGTGKELIARALHALSGRTGELVAVNVAGLDDTVFADTLFGHVRGAFTGASSPRRGIVERATGGTLFLDEIGDLSAASQVKLLRLLQEGEYYPLGSDSPRWMRSRLIVATHQDLSSRQQAGSFRRDLFYRLRSHHIHIPPLRERRGDIPILLDHFLESAAQEFGKKKPSAPKELTVLLENYHFPGNVRELRAMVYDAVSLHQGKLLSMNAFKRAIVDQKPPPLAAKENSFELNPLRSLERFPTLSEARALLVHEALRRTNGNQSIASRMLGITQSALSKWLKAAK